MKKDEILNASRKEHQNKDLAEMEVLYLAGSHASRVGASVCCLLSLLSSMLAHTVKKLWDLLYCQQLLSDYALCCMDKLNIIKAFFEERKL